MLFPAEIVFAFFAPPSIAAAAFYGLEYIESVPSAAGTLAALALAAIPPIASTWSTYRKSQRRNRLLDELAKHEEAQRAGAAG